MGTVSTSRYVRKPLYVDAVQVTADTFEDVAKWCMGDVIHNDGPEYPTNAGEAPQDHHIRLRVHNPQSVRQTKAFVGDWILYTDRGYKIYTEKAFKDNFDKVSEPFSDGMTRQAEEAETV